MRNIIIGIVVISFHILIGFLLIHGQRKDWYENKVIGGFSRAWDLFIALLSLINLTWGYCLCFILAINVLCEKQIITESSRFIDITIFLLSFLLALESIMVILRRGNRKGFLLSRRIRVRSPAKI
jgi:hypothetical protein